MEGRQLTVTSDDPAYRDLRETALGFATANQLRPDEVSVMLVLLGVEIIERAQGKQYPNRAAADRFKRAMDIILEQVSHSFEAGLIHRDDPARRSSPQLTDFASPDAQP